MSISYYPGNIWVKSETVNLSKIKMKEQKSIKIHSLVSYSEASDIFFKFLKSLKIVIPKHFFHRSINQEFTLNRMIAQLLSHQILFSF